MDPVQLDALSSKAYEAAQMALGYAVVPWQQLDPPTKEFYRRIVEAVLEELEKFKEQEAVFGGAWRG